MRIKIIFPFLLYFLLFNTASASETEATESMDLQAQLQAMREKASQSPAEKRKIMDRATEKLRRQHLGRSAPKVGDTFPDLTLSNSHGKKITLSQELKKGPVVISFYRGAWCPYCNLQLHAYQKRLPEIRAKGAQLIAITPEKPDLTAKMQNEKKYEFTVLTDPKNHLAKKLGLAFKLPNNLKKLYLTFGINLEKSQGNASWELPVPATFVIDKSSKVLFSYIDVDYKQRADINKILDVLDLNLK